MNTPPVTKQVVCAEHDVVRALCAGLHVPAQREPEQRSAVAA